MTAPTYSYGQAPAKQYYEGAGQDVSYGVDHGAATKGQNDWLQGYDNRYPVVQQPPQQPQQQQPQQQYSTEPSPQGGVPADPYRYQAYASPGQQPPPQPNHGQKTSYGPPPAVYQHGGQQQPQQQPQEQPSYQPPYGQQGTPQVHQAPPASPQEYPPYYGHGGPQKVGPPQQQPQQPQQQPSPMHQQPQYAYNSRVPAHQQQQVPLPPPVQFAQPGQQPFVVPEYTSIGQAVRDLSAEDETFKGIVKACVSYFSKEYDKMQKNMVNTTANMKSRMKEIDERLASIATTEAALKKEKETLTLERKQVESNVKTYERDVSNMGGEKEKMSALLSDLGGVLMRVEKKLAPAATPQEAPAAPRVTKPDFDETVSRPTVRGRGDPRDERTPRHDTDDEEEDLPPRRGRRENSRASARSEPNGSTNGRRSTRDSSRDARETSRDGRREPKRDDRKESRRRMSSEDDYSSDARDTRHTRSNRHEDYQATMRDYKPATERRRTATRQWKD